MVVERKKSSKNWQARSSALMVQGMSRDMYRTRAYPLYVYAHRLDDLTTNIKNKCEIYSRKCFEWYPREFVTVRDPTIHACSTFRCKNMEGIVLRIKYQVIYSTYLVWFTEREEMPLALPVALASLLRKLFIGCPSVADREKDLRKSQSFTIPSFAPDVASTYSSTNATAVTLCWDVCRLAAMPASTSGVKSLLFARWWKASVCTASVPGRDTCCVFKVRELEGTAAFRWTYRW